MRINSWKIYGLIVCVMTLLIGCQPPSPEYDFYETQERVEEAKSHADTARILDSDGQYEFEVRQAQTKAIDAETELNLRRLSDAYTSAMSSLQASKRVFKHVYLDRIARLAQQSKQAIEIEIQKDADTPLKNLLPELDRILDVAAELHAGRVEISLDMLQDDLTTTVQAEKIVEGITKGKMESDFSFEPGKYTLSPQGTAYLRQIVEQIAGQIETLLRDFPDKTILVELKVVGYTDEQSFREGTTLIKDLTEGVEHLTPDRGIPRRQFLNQRLSQFRAQRISDDFKQLLAEIRRLSAQMELREEVIGQGELIPQGVSAPYPTDDPRRRICKIYSYVIVQ